MLFSVTGLTPSGLRDWLVQRVSAVVLGTYLLFLIGYFFSQSSLDFAHWQGLFTHTGMRIFTFLAMLSLCGHAWIGLWTVTTDYIKQPFRIFVQIFAIIALIACLIWGMMILWG